MIVRETLDSEEKLTEEQLRELDQMMQKPTVFDEECPPFTEEELREFHRVSEINQEDRRKQVVTLRLSPQAIRKAKSLGKGYTSVLSRLLETALNDNEMIRRCL